MKLRSILAKKLHEAARLIGGVEASDSGASRHPRTCPICDFTGQFSAYGRVPRPNAKCPKFKSLERHRLLKLMYDRIDAPPANARMLHFAPERAVESFTRAHYSEYVTADLMRDDVDLKLNIEAIDLDTGSFDAIICSHVLEHVDDAKALSEMFRVLKPGGLAILAVPIVEGWDLTYEDPTITDKAGRLLHFGQHDHVRQYGRDFRERVRRAGFELEEFVVDGAESVTYSLRLGARVFLARKPLNADAA